MIGMKKEQSRRKRRGFALPLTIAMIVLLIIVGLGLQRLGLSARMQAAWATTQINATAAADAGFTNAMYVMNKNLNVKPWNFNNIASPANVVLPSTNANYTYTLEEIAVDSEYKITSIGRSGWATKTVSATVRLQGLFDYPIFAQGYAIPKRPKAPKQHPPAPKPLKKGGKLEIKGYNLVGYSSDPSQTYSGPIQMRSNNSHRRSVKLREDVVINADIVVGPGGNPNKVVEKKDGAVVTGDTYAATERQELLSVSEPWYYDSTKAENYNYNTQKGDPISGIVKYNTFTIPKDGVQEIAGDTTIFVENHMKIEEGAQLIVTEGASLKIYVYGNLDVKKKSGGLINETKVAKNLLIYGMDTCRKVKIETPFDFYGAVYAPFAKVELKSSADLYGAFAGWDVKLKKKKGGEQGTFYYDRSLRTGDVVTSDDGVGRFVVKSWREE